MEAHLHDGDYPRAKPQPAAVFTRFYYDSLIGTLLCSWKKGRGYDQTTSLTSYTFPRACVQHKSFRGTTSSPCRDLAGRRC